jgi:hypothetical protein
MSEWKITTGISFQQGIVFGIELEIFALGKNSVEFILTQTVYDFNGSILSCSDFILKPDKIRSYSIYTGSIMANIHSQ